MGNKLTKEKRDAIEQQKKHADAAKGLDDLRIDDVIDSPHYAIAKDIPAYQAFFFPPSVKNITAREYLTSVCMLPFAVTEVDLTQFPPEVAVQVLPLLPLMLLRLPKLVKLNASKLLVVAAGPSGGQPAMAAALTLLLAALPGSAALRTLSLEANALGPALIDLLVKTLLLFPPRTPARLPLEIECHTGNPFWDQTSDEWNITLEKQLAQLEAAGYNVRPPSKPEKPFDVEGVNVLPSAVVDATPVPINGIVFISKALFDFGGLKDAENKIKFLMSIVNKIITFRKKPDHHPALRYIPRIYHVKRENDTIIGIIAESIAKNVAFGNLEELMTEAVANDRRMLWRVNLVIQVAQVVHFFHTEAGAAIRNITPKELLVDIENQTMRYTNVEALRSPQAFSVVRKNDAAKFKFEDPKYAGVDRRVTLPRDLYPMAQLAFFLLCFNPKPDAFKLSFSFPFIDASDLDEPTTFFMEKLTESLGDRMSEENRQKIARLIAESIQPSEEDRPSVAAFLDVWQGVKASITV